MGLKCQFGGFLRLPFPDFAAGSPIDFAAGSPPLSVDTRRLGPATSSIRGTRTAMHHNAVQESTEPPCCNIVIYPYYDKTRDIQSDIASVKVSSRGQKTKGIIVAKGNI